MSTATIPYDHFDRNTKLPPRKPAEFKPRDAAKWNNIHTRYFEDFLNGAIYSESVDRSIALAIWNESGGRAVFPVTNARIAERCGKSVDWVNLHMPDFIRRRLEARDGLIRRVQIGRDGQASQWSVAGLIAFINQLHDAHPFTREEHMREGQRIADELRMSEKEATDELAKIEARRQRREEAKAEAAEHPKPEPSPFQYLTKQSEKMTAWMGENAVKYNLSPEQQLEGYRQGLAPILQTMEDLDGLVGWVQAVKITAWSADAPDVQTGQTATPVHESSCTTVGEMRELHAVSYTAWSAGIPYDLFRIEEVDDGAETSKQGSDEGGGRDTYPPDIWALVSLEDAGIERVSVVFVDPATNKGIEDTYRTFATLHEFTRAAPALRKQAWCDGVSMVVTPIDPPLGYINIDDLDTEQIDRCRPFAHNTPETSPGSFHARFLVSDVATETDAKRIRAGICRALGGDANAGGGGAYRWPGSPNAKPERRLPDGSMPMVRLDAYTGRSVTLDQLRDAGLYAEEPTPIDRGGMCPSAGVGDTPATKGKWPSYSRELARVPGAKSHSGPNRSTADARWCFLALDFGWCKADVEGELPFVSDNARHEGHKYVVRTVDNAYEDWVLRGKNRHRARG